MEDQTFRPATDKIPALETYFREAIQGDGDGIDLEQYSVFYELYQIDTHLQDDETEGRSDRGHKGLKSLWGSLWSVCTSTGWTLDYLLWKISWINLQMMIIDAPRYTNDSKKEEIIPEPESIEELDEIMRRLNR